MLHSSKSHMPIFLFLFSMLCLVIGECRPPTLEVTGELIPQGKPHPNAKDFWPPAFNIYNYTATVNMTADGGFPYIIPWSNTQSCNIFGALCQLGSIAVNSVGQDSRTSLVTLACSSYLSSQSSFLQNAPVTKHVEWSRRFGRSPQCHSFASMLSETQSTAPWTFSECQGTEAIGTVNSDLPNAVPTQVPGSLVFPKQEICCGKCDFIIPEIQLFYFPDPNAEAWCSSRNRTMFRPKMAANDTTGDGLRRRRAQVDPAPTMTQQGAAPTVVISGQTLCVVLQL